MRGAIRIDWKVDNVLRTVSVVCAIWFGVETDLILLRALTTLGGDTFTPTISSIPDPGAPNFAKASTSNGVF